MVLLGLRFCARAFSSCGERGPPSSRCAGLSPPRPLPLRRTGSRRAGSAAVAHGPSRSAACGILPDQGSNPCPLHRQADSQPLRHQGSPSSEFDDLFWFNLNSTLSPWLLQSKGECILGWFYLKEECMGIVENKYNYPTAFNDKVRGDCM